MHKTFLILFTVLGIIFGIVSIGLIVLDFPLIYPVTLILLSAIIDRYDGRLARRFRLTSALGEQLDYVNDIVSFLLAPMVMFVLMGHGPLTRSILIAIMFISAGLYRLHRYHINKPSPVFKGIPTTLAGSVVVISTALLSGNAAFTVPLITLSLSALMISNVRCKKI